MAGGFGGSPWALSFLEGITFISNYGSATNNVADRGLNSYADWLPLVITWTHLLGGFLVIIGLFTRWAVLLQIPILLGAVIFINAPRGVFAAESEFGLALVILLLLIFFLF